MTPRARARFWRLLAVAGPLAGANPVSAPDTIRDSRIQVAATTSAAIGAPMPGRLSEFPLRDGDRFEKGHILARFVCAERDGAPRCHWFV